MKRRLAMAALVVLLASRASVADTVVGPPAGPAPGTAAGTGLNADYYKTASPAGSIQNAQATIMNSAPTATFVSTSIDYPNDTSTYVTGYSVSGNAATQTGFTAEDSSTLAGYLGSDSSTLSPSSAGTNTLEDSIDNFTGYLDVTKAGPVTFYLGSDDGSELWINGVSVVSNDGDHHFAQNSATVDFSSPGLYPIQVIYFEDSLETGVALTSDITGSITYVPTSLLYQGIPTASTPEPSPFILAAFGILGFVGYDRRRRSRRAP